MLLSLVYFLPCIVSLLWFTSFVMKKKNHRQRMFCYAQGASAVFCAVMGIYFFPDLDYYTMVRMEALCIPFGVLFPAFLVQYMYMYCFDRRVGHTVSYLMLTPAVVIAVAINLLCYVIGFDMAAEISRQQVSQGGLSGSIDTPLNRAYCFFTYDAFVALMVCFVVLMLALCVGTLYRHGYRFGDVFRFFFRGKPTMRSRTIAVMYIVELAVLSVLMALGTGYFRIHPALGALLMVALAAAKHLISYIEFYSDDNKMVTLYELSHLSLSISEDADAQSDLLPSTLSAPQPEEQQKPTPAQVKMDRRLEHFRQLMEERKVWKDEDLTAQSVCDMMDIGKTTLSALISQNYDCTFRDLVNRYRIEEAKTYMIANPKATQETVGMHCGFKNAQYFNTQFKRIVGETPAMWLAGNRETR